MVRLLYAGSGLRSDSPAPIRNQRAALAGAAPLPCNHFDVVVPALLANPSRSIRSAHNANFDSVALRSVISWSVSDANSPRIIRHHRTDHFIDNLLQLHRDPPASSNN